MLLGYLLNFTTPLLSFIRHLDIKSHLQTFIIFFNKKERDLHPVRLSFLWILYL